MQLLYWLLPTIAVSIALTVAIIYAIRRHLRGGEPTRIQDIYAESQAKSSQTSKDVRPAQKAVSASVWHCKHCQYENDNHMSFCSLCAESRKAPSVGTKVSDVLIPIHQGVNVPMRSSPPLPPLQPRSAASSAPTRPPSLGQSSQVLPAVAAFGPPANPVPTASSSMRESTPARNTQHLRDTSAAPGLMSLTNSQRKRVKSEAELTFIRATNAVARGDLATAFKDLNRALLLEPSNTKVLYACCSHGFILITLCAVQEILICLIVLRPERPVCNCNLISMPQMIAYRALVVSKMNQTNSASASSSGTAASAAATATAAAFTIEQDAAYLRRQRALRHCVERAAAARAHGDLKTTLMEMKQALECDPSNAKVTITFTVILELMAPHCANTLDFLFRLDLFSYSQFRAEVDELEAKLALVKNSRRRDFYKCVRLH